MFTQFHQEFLRKFADVGIASAVSVGAGAIHVRRAGKAPPSVGEERTRKFLALQTPQMAGNGTSRVF